MTRAYEIVVLAKEKNHIESDYAIAKLLGIDQSHLGHWKKGRAEPNAINYLKLIKLAGLSIDDALLKMTEPPCKPDDTPKNGANDVYYVKLISEFKRQLQLRFMHQLRLTFRPVQKLIQTA